MAGSGNGLFVVEELFSEDFWEACGVDGWDLHPAWALGESVFMTPEKCQDESLAAPSGPCESPARASDGEELFDSDFWEPCEHSWESPPSWALCESVFAAPEECQQSPAVPFEGQVMASDGACFFNFQPAVRLAPAPAQASECLFNFEPGRGEQ